MTDEKLATFGHIEIVHPDPAGAVLFLVESFGAKEVATEIAAKLVELSPAGTHIAHALVGGVVFQFVKPAPESYELLSSGVADGTFFPLESIISFKLGSVIKYATLFPGGFYSSSFGFFMNEDRWNKLSKQDQDAIMSVSGEPLALLAGKAWDATQVSEAAPELIKGVQERAQAINDKWVKDATAKGIDGAKVLAEFREEVKRVAAEK